MRLSLALASAMTLALLTSAPVPLTGCSSDAKSCSDYEPPASLDSTTPVISFKTQVFPIFTGSCAFSSCHGQTSGSSNGVFLGGSDASAVRAGLVNIAPPELASGVFIKPGAPHDSYLMRKLDASQCLLDAQCTDGSCGDSMPQNDNSLPIDTRDLVRRWIAQGALDN